MLLCNMVCTVVYTTLLQKSDEQSVMRLSGDSFFRRDLKEYPRFDDRQKTLDCSHNTLSKQTSMIIELMMHKIYALLGRVNKNLTPVKRGLSFEISVKSPILPPFSIPASGHKFSVVSVLYTTSTMLHSSKQFQTTQKV